MKICIWQKGGIIHGGKVAEKLGVKGIPAAAEDCGTAREIALAAAYNVPIHICHVSTATSIALIRDAKARGVAVTAETAPHYFTLTEEELLKRDADYRMNPPLRTEADRLAVIEALKDGTLDAIAQICTIHRKKKADFEKSTKWGYWYGNLFVSRNYRFGQTRTLHYVATD